MLGAYRFLLALLVALEHMRLITNIHIGVIAVVGFYSLAGFVMNHSFSKNFGSDIKKIPDFYLDRFLRVYPVYLFVVICVILFFALTDPAAIILKPLNFLINITLIPLNYFYFIGDSNYFILNPNGIAVPPAPSLALELQFYLVFPFILYYRPLLYIIYPISLTIFCLAAFNIINIYHFGYILLPGTLFIFLSGTILYNYIHNIDTKICKTYLISMLSLLLVMLVRFSFTKIELYNLEIIAGIFIGMGAIYILSKAKAKSKLDNFLGNISYPIFLSHWFSIWIFEYLIQRNYFVDISLHGRIVLQVLLTIIMSMIIYQFVDLKVQKFRKKIQTRGVVAPLVS